MNTKTILVVLILNIILIIGCKKNEIPDSYEPGAPLIRSAYLHFASSTKNITAVVILNMQREGWLNISDKLTDYKNH